MYLGTRLVAPILLRACAFYDVTSAGIHDRRTILIMRNCDHCIDVEVVFISPNINYLGIHLPNLNECAL